MNGTITKTQGKSVTVHTYTAPENGWRANSHLIELTPQLIIIDAPLRAVDAREVIALGASLGKPVTRLYISHGHPDHFAAAGLFDAPTYALEAVARRIKDTGDFAIKGSYQLTPGHEDSEAPAARPIDHIVELGEEVIDRVRFDFEPVAGGDTTAQLTIGLPDEGILIAQDVVYNGVHAFIAEQCFDAWIDSIDALAAKPYETILPGHGLPGDHSLFAATRSYIAAARAALKEASGPDDLSRRLNAAYPSYDGTALQPLQNFFLYGGKP